MTKYIFYCNYCYLRSLYNLNPAYVSHHICTSINADDKWFTNPFLMLICRLCSTLECSTPWLLSPSPMSTHFRIPKLFVSDNCILGSTKFLTFSERLRQSMWPFFKFVQQRKITPLSPKLYQIVSKSRGYLKYILRKDYFSLFIQSSEAPKLVITMKLLTS